MSLPGTFLDQWSMGPRPPRVSCGQALAEGLVELPSSGDREGSLG